MSDSPPSRMTQGLIIESIPTSPSHLRRQRFRVILDGNDISHQVIGLKLDMRAGEIAHAEITYVVAGPIHVDLDQAVTDEARNAS